MPQRITIERNLLATANAGTTEGMSRKRTPEASPGSRPRRIALIKSVAYARKQRTGDSEDDGDMDNANESAKTGDKKAEPAKVDVKPDGKPAAKGSRTKEDTLPEPLPEAPMEQTRARVDTIGMPAYVGAPPEIPDFDPPDAATVVVPLSALGSVEDPTHMPGPREVPGGMPDDLAPPPGHVPPGDSRSLRRRADRLEFALVYRQANAVISRWGVIGTRGQWRVVEYPTTASASHAYAKECSRFVSDGFSDYRD